MPLPNIYGDRREVVAGYDWIDLASGTGYILFDGVNAINSTGNHFILVDASANDGISPVETVLPTLALARVLSSVYRPAGGGSARGGDVDFDLSPFQLPRTIEGEAFARASIVGEQAGGQGGSNVFIKAILKKEDAAIVTVQSATEANLTAAEQLSHVLKLTVPKTHFKAGEKLRLTIEIWGDDAEHIGLAHNPSDTAIAEGTVTGAFTAGNSRLTLLVPFKLDFM